MYPISSWKGGVILSKYFSTNLNKGEINMKMTSKKIGFMKIAILSLVTTFILSFGIGDVIAHQFGMETTHTAEAALKNKVKKNSTSTLESTIEGAGDKVVSLAREVAIVAVILIVIWMGYSLLIKKSAEGLADMKGRLGALVLALIFVFFSEQVLGALFGIFGYTIS